MAPMARQVETGRRPARKTCRSRTIAPGHGPAISEKAGAACWPTTAAGGESQGKAQAVCGPALRSGLRQNNRAIADALAQGVFGTGVRVESGQLHSPRPHATASKTISAGCDALLIGSPPWAAIPPPRSFRALGHPAAESPTGPKPWWEVVRQAISRQGESTCWKRNCATAASAFRLREPSGEVQPRRPPTLPAPGGNRHGPGEGTAGVSSAASKRFAAGGLSQSLSQHRGAWPWGRIVGFALRAHHPPAAKARPLLKCMVASGEPGQLHPAGFTVAVAKDRPLETLLMLAMLHAQRAA